MSTFGGFSAPGEDTTTVADTPTIDLTESPGGEITADVIISPDPGNVLVANPNGLFVPAAAVDQTTVSDTPTVNLTETGNDITADVKVSAAPGNAISVNPDGLFAPVDVPECPYQPRMTRAAALALRAAGSLKENCVVVITDGPGIGVGPVSITEITLQPVSANEFGEGAWVNTTFDNEAWRGRYDIDQNTIYELTDSSGNTVKDTDAGAPSITTQFPWHRGTTIGGTLRDNYIEDSTLVGWVTAASVQGNTIRESTVNLTGFSGFLWENTIWQSTVVTGALTGNVQGNTLFGANWNLAGTLTLTAFRSEWINSTITSAAGSNQNYTINGSRFTNGHTLNVGAAAVGGTPSNINGVNASGGVWTKNGIGGFDFSNTTFNATTVNLLGNGNIGAAGSTINGSTIANPAGASIRGLFFSVCSLTNATVNQNRTLNTAYDQFVGATITNSTVTLTGAGGGPAGTQVVINGGDIKNGSTVTITDPNGANSINNTTVDNAVVNSQTNGFLTGCRIANGATVNTGGFAHVNTIVDLPGVTTFTAPNVNRLRNKAFSDVV